MSTRLATDSRGGRIQVLKPGTTTTVDNTTGSAFTSGTRVVRLTCTAAANYGFNGSADVPLPANVVEYVRVDEGDAITTSAAIVVTEMN